jgi:hydroxymethylpyrimidine/phosphomethylpyrimidine kinase
LNAVLDDLPIGAIKTGMLPNVAVIDVVADILKSRCKGIPLIVDPVLVATSGANLTVEDTASALQRRLFPLASLITPNLAEAGILSGAGSAAQTTEVAGRLLAYGCRAVLLKGGHGEAETMVDLLISKDGETAFEHPAMPGDFHGTGCVLSAAIAAQMALGAGLEDAVRSGIEHVQSAIANARLPLSGNLHILG